MREWFFFIQYALNVKTLLWRLRGEESIDRKLTYLLCSLHLVVTESPAALLLSGGLSGSLICTILVQSKNVEKSEICPHVAGRASKLEQRVVYDAIASNGAEDRGLI